MMAERYPFDIQILVKGQEYDMQDMGLLPAALSDARRRLRLLELRDTVQRQADAAGKCMSIVTKGDRILRVMTDSEASEYHDKRSGLALHALRTQVDSLRKRVDRGLLTDEQKERHERSIARRGMQYMAAMLPMSKHRQILDEKRVRRLEDNTKDRPNPFKR